MKVHIKKQRLQEIMNGKGDKTVRREQVKQYGRWYLKPGEFNRLKEEKEGE